MNLPKLKPRDKTREGYDVSGWICPETFLGIQEIKDCLNNLENLSNQDKIRTAQTKFCAKPYYEFCVKNTKEIKGRLEFIFYPVFYLIDEKECCVKIKTILKPENDLNSLTINEIKDFYNELINQFKDGKNYLIEYTESRIRTIEEDYNYYTNLFRSILKDSREMENNQYKDFSNYNMPRN